MQKSDDKRPCVKCGLETCEGLYDPAGTIPFCEWCMQAFMGRVWGDWMESSPNGTSKEMTRKRTLTIGAT